MREALAQARQQLGEDAVILHTKQFDTPSLLGAVKSRGVEILAASDMAVGTQGSSEHRTRPATIERLIKNGVSEHIAESMLHGCDDSPNSAIKALERRIACCGADKVYRGQRRIALVGPTGVGKTTTIAKLAAWHQVHEGKKVALMTLDTYRIGAVEQLATYARILDIPMEVALCPEDGSALVSRHSDKDVILVDTVGRSQRNREHIDELAGFLRVVQPNEVHLVVSASSDSTARQEAVESFGTLNPTRMTLTKLDESSRLGCIAELAATSLMPFSYVTFGQDVPDDIAVAESSTLAQLAWEGSL